MSKVAIIGGGIIGLHCAYALHRLGHQVTVIDAGQPQDARCSSGNAGMIVPSHITPLAAPGMVRYGLGMLLRKGSPFGIAWPPSFDQMVWMARFARACTARHVERSAPILRDLSLASRAEYLRLFTELGIETQLHLKGLDAVCKKPATFEHEKEIARRAQDLGLEVEIIAAQDIPAREPLYAEGLAGMIRYHQDGWFDPGAWQARMRQSLEGQVLFMDQTTVHDADIRQQRIHALQTQQGDIQVDEVVLAAGVWSQELGRKLWLNLPMVAGKGISLDIESEPGPKVCALLIEARAAITPLPHGVRVAGTMQLGPPDRPVAPSRIEGLKQSIQHYLPRLQPKLMNGPAVWQGSRPCSPDGLPFLGRAMPLENLVVATGHAMMGVSLAAITGKLVGEMVSGKNPTLPLEALCPHRFSR